MQRSGDGQGRRRERRTAPRTMPDGRTRPSRRIRAGGIGCGGQVGLAAVLVLLLSVPVDRGPLAAPPMASSAAGATLPGEPPASALAGADLVPELVPYAGPEPSAAAAPAATRRPGVAADSLAFGYREWRHSLERGLAGHDFAAGSHDGAAARSGALAGRPEPAAWQDHFGEMARLSGLLAGIVREGRPHGLDARFRR